MESLLQDIRYGLRVLLKSPGFAAVAVLSLALGIGANTAIFSMVDKVMVRLLPVEEPAQLVSVAANHPRGLNTSFHYPLYVDYRDRNDVFSGLICYAQIPFSLSYNGQTDRVYGQIVSGNYFSVLGVEAALGRTFAPEEDQTPSAHPVAVIGYGLWQRRFASDPAVVGKPINLNGHTFTVIGVAPAEFTSTVRGANPDIYVPMMMQPQAMPLAMGQRDLNPLTSRNYTWLSIMGRLRPGVTREQAQERMRMTAEEIAKVNPTNMQTEVLLLDASKGETYLVRDLSTPLILLMAIVGLVLLIACANVANLLLARANARRKEIAIRLAIGAGRVRIIRQLLTESILLSITGGIIGLLFARWITNFLLAFRPPSNWLSLEGSIDMRVLAFSLALSLLTGIIFGLVPALQTSKPDMISALKDEGAMLVKGARRFNMRNSLVAAQVALSLVVLISAALCIRSLQKLQSIETGFEPAKVLVMSIDLGLNGYSEASGQQFFPQLIEGVSALAGVESVSLARIVPLGGGSMRRSVAIDGVEQQPDEPLNFNMNIVAPGYFKTMGMRLVQGRDFGPQDAASSQKVVIINETIAARYWPGQDPIGKQISFGRRPNAQSEDRREIIGVVKDSKYRSLTEGAELTMFLPLAQNYMPTLALHVRTAGDPAAISAAVRQQIQSMDANLPIFNIRTLADQMSSSLYTERMAATLLSAFGLLALLLAAIGIYGVMAYSVSRRTHEIGIRMALGAKQWDVLKLVLVEGMAVVAAGLTIGIAGAYGATRWLSSFLYGVSTTDPVIFAIIASLLAAVALVANYFPARRASKVDPMIALRYE